MAASSLMLAGSKSGKFADLAQSKTGRGGSFFGGGSGSGRVTTNGISCPASRRRWQVGTAKGPVPITMMRIDGIVSQVLMR
jgi:hypothetical protein